ncbi:MAG TPA: SH3 domain-containing protein [Candidatus Sulfomarinibacteraceae bacterium]|nr:SH3 domain-containing protein [Candidatus Sulfomarinibacteraceae bacterium]
MSGIFLPVLLTALAFLAALIAYRDIRRGGARFYTLEREAILRRASFTLIAAALLFLGAIGLLLYERQQNLQELAVQAGEEIEGVPTPTATLSSLPPTETPTATPDPDAPTITPTPRVCRAIVRGTGESGLNLREEPGGAELQVLQEEEIVSLLEEPSVESGGVTWVRVRAAITRTEGWVALDFLVIEDDTCLDLIQ